MTAWACEAMGEKGTTMQRKVGFASGYRRVVSVLRVAASRENRAWNLGLLGAVLAFTGGLTSLGCSTNPTERGRPEQLRTVKQAFTPTQADLTFSITGVLANTSASGQTNINIEMRTNWDTGPNASQLKRVFQCGTGLTVELQCAHAERARVV